MGEINLPGGGRLMWGGGRHLLDFRATVGGQKYVDTQTFDRFCSGVGYLAQSNCLDDFSCIAMAIMV